MIRTLAFLLIVGLAASSPAGAQQQHWLLGKWTGTLTNLPATNRFGSERTMDVKSVSSDGTKAQASWGTGAGTSQINIAINGNEVTFTTPGSGGASYKLMHNAGALVGSWSPIGGASSGGSVNLKKQ